MCCWIEHKLFLIVSFYVAQACFESVVLLFQSLSSWNYRPMPPTLFVQESRGQSRWAAAHELRKAGSLRAIPGVQGVCGLLTSAGARAIGRGRRMSSGRADITISVRNSPVPGV